MYSSTEGYYAFCIKFCSSFVARMCHVVMWWLSTVVCHLISVTFKYFIAVWLLLTGLFMIHHLRAEFRISLKNVCRLFLKEWIIQGGLFGGCLGCLPCNSCQPSVERIASSPCSQFCLFVLWLGAKILGNILCKASQLNGFLICSGELP